MQSNDAFVFAGMFSVCVCVCVWGFVVFCFFNLNYCTPAGKRKENGPSSGK